MPPAEKIHFFLNCINLNLHFEVLFVSSGGLKLTTLPKINNRYLFSFCKDTTTLRQPYMMSLIKTILAYNSKSIPLHSSSVLSAPLLWGPLQQRCS